MTDERFEKLVYIIHLLDIDGIGPLKIFSLLSKFHNPTEMFHANISTLIEVDGINKNLSTRILNSVHNISQSKAKLETTLSTLSKINGRIITYWDEDYPELLKRIYYPPILLYVIGELTEDDKNSIAIVGTRMPTNYGKQNAETFARDLALTKITVVSGMARGIDSTAHRAALNSKGRTIAVIGSGLDVIYPPENKKLFEEICENGVVISEYDLGTKPDAQNFPRRNRIISGISLGSLIIETKLNGGAMQTAAYAIDQNREVFAIPGNINSKQSEGPNALIQRGEAKLVTTTEDILIELNLRIKPEIGKNIPKPSFDLNLFEQNLMDTLNNQPMHIDEIANVASMSVSDCLVNLLTLEFKGLVKQLPGKMFVKC